MGQKPKKITPRKGKEKAALQPTNTRKKVKAVERVPLCRLVRPNRPDLWPADFGSEEDEHKAPDRKSAMENALEFKDNLKVKSEDAHRSINAFLERNGLHADNPYKHAMQKLVNGDASLITRKIRGELFEYIKQTIMNLRHYLRKLLKIEKLDDEIASLIVKAIEETHQNLGVRLIELEDIACLARSIVSETVKEFQVAKGGFVRDCIVFWFIKSMEYCFDNEKYAEEWIKNPTTSLTTIDPEKTAYFKGVAFKIPRSVN
ncbi:hypothetical protein ACHQM5_002221 [Ranunculus cassubicifolius]